MSHVANATPAAQVRLIAEAFAAEPETQGSIAPDHAARLVALSREPDRAAAARTLGQWTSALLEDTGQGLQLAEADLAGLDLSGLDLRGAVLNRARLHGTDLSGADLSGAALICPGMERTKLRRAKLAGAYVHALAAQVCDFTDADLSALVDATGCLFHGCNLERASFAGAKLAGSAFYQCLLKEARFAGANLQGAAINECILDGADFSAALLAQAALVKCRLSGASFAGATGEGLTIRRPTAAAALSLERAGLPHLVLDGLKARRLRARGLMASGADIHDCDLPEADFAGAALGGARFARCGLARADFSDAALDGASLLACAGEDVVFERAAGENLHAVECSFPAARMRGFGGRCATFRDCAMGGTDLSEAYLYRAMLTGDPPRAMDLSAANLEGAVLVQSYLAADLSGASLRNVRAAYARLNQCVLREADLSGVSLYEASLVKADCTGARFANLVPPLFADRSPGLTAALEDAGSGAAGEVMLGYLHNLDALLRRGAKGST